MKIETKFEVGQKVCFLKGSKLIQKPIHSINIELREKETEIKYWFKNQNPFEVGGYEFESIDESMIFANRDEFFNQLDIEQ
jgi:hypothetical protein